jgi:hypothetical protein
MILCIDPGVNYFGWCFGKSPASAPMYGTMHGAFSLSEIELLPKDTRLVLVEMPRIYPKASGAPNRAARADPNDIVELARAVGVIQGTCQTLGIPIQLVAPRDWKGSKPKEVMTAQIKTRFNEVFKRPLKADSHATDAVGMWLNHFDLLNIKSYPRGLGKE